MRVCDCVYLTLYMYDDNHTFGNLWTLIGNRRQDSFVYITNSQSHPFNKNELILML